MFTTQFGRALGLNIFLLNVLACTSQANVPVAKADEHERVQNGDGSTNENTGPVNIIQHTIDVAGSPLFYLDAGQRETADTTVLLLHGARFSSATWKELGTIRILAAAGYAVVAIDLPGYGRSRAAPVDRRAYLAEVIRTLGLERPIVVAASMSGSFAYPLIEQNLELLGGFVGIAPAGTPAFAKKADNVVLPTLVVWGENDNVFPVEQADMLVAAIAGSQKLILKNAGHPAYLDAPVEFHKGLLDFLNALPKD